MKIIKVFCIDDHDLDAYKVKLTPGKIYDVILYNILPVKTRHWLIKNDVGIKNWYSSDVIIPLEEWRDKQLNELGI